MRVRGVVDERAGRRQGRPVRGGRVDDERTATIRRHPVSRSAHAAGRPQRVRPPARPRLRVVEGAPTRRSMPVPRPFPVTVLYGAVSTLLALGLVMVLSAGSVASLEFYGWSYHYFAWQAP